jgi:hypothetical protein
MQWVAPVSSFPEPGEEESVHPGFRSGQEHLHIEFFRINQTGLAIYRPGSTTALHPLPTLKIEGSPLLSPLFGDCPTHEAKEKNRIFF